MSGTLYLVATPIGNLGTSFRGREDTGGGDFIAEDTWVSMKLLNHFEIKSPWSAITSTTMSPPGRRSSAGCWGRILRLGHRRRHPRHPPTLERSSGVAARGQRRERYCPSLGCCAAVNAWRSAARPQAASPSRASSVIMKDLGGSTWPRWKTRSAP